MARILIVDDSRTSRKFLRDVLEADHHEIVGEAENGVEAIQKYRELHPDIVTMDITMPELDGISALKEILLINANTQVVMVTAAAQKYKVIEAIKYGAKDYLTKPFDVQRIYESICSLQNSL